MDAILTATLSTLALSIVGNVAAWWQIANQARKDKGDALLALVNTQRTEIDRLQTRGIELENTLIAKTTENGELKLAAIDKEAELRTIKYKAEETEAKLNAVLKNQPKKSTYPSLVGDFNPIKMKEAAKEDRNKKAKVSERINMELRELRNNSIGNKLKL